MKRIFLALLLVLTMGSFSFAGEPKPDYFPVDGKELELLDSNEYAFCGVRIGDSAAKAYPIIVSNCAGGYKMLVDTIEEATEKVVPLEKADLILVQDAPSFEIRNGKIHAVFIPAYLYEPWIGLTPNYTKLELESKVPHAVTRYTGAYFVSKSGNTMLFRRGNYYISVSNLGDLYISK